MPYEPWDQEDGSVSATVQAHALEAVLMRGRPYVVPWAGLVMHVWERGGDTRMLIHVWDFRGELVYAGCGIPPCCGPVPVSVN